MEHGVRVKEVREREGNLEFLPRCATVSMSFSSVLELDDVKEPHGGRPW